MAKKNFYAVKEGIKPGIYKTWPECSANIKGYSGAVYKGFETLEEAEAFMAIDTSSNINNTSEKNGEEILPDIYAFTDGSYNIATKVYGFGGFLHNKEEDIPLRGHGCDPEVVGSRNVAGEVYGAIEAMKTAISMGIEEITLFYDYEGVAKWPLKLWKANKPISQQYVKQYDEMSSRLKVNFCHVKAHTGIPGNELADKMAKEEAGI